MLESIFSQFRCQGTGFFLVNFVKNTAIQAHTVQKIKGVNQYLVVAERLLARHLIR